MTSRLSKERIYSTQEVWLSDLQSPSPLICVILVANEAVPIGQTRMIELFLCDDLW